MERLGATGGDGLGVPGLLAAEGVVHRCVAALPQGHRRDERRAQDSTREQVAWRLHNGFLRWLAGTEERNEARELRFCQRQHEDRAVVFDVPSRRHVASDAGPRAVDTQRPGVHYEPAAEFGGEWMRRLELLEGDLVLPERDEPDASGRRPRRGGAELGGNAGIS